MFDLYKNDAITSFTAIYQYFFLVQVDKRKRLEEEALSKKLESESNYRASVDEANERHRNLLLVKSEVSYKSR